VRKIVFAVVFTVGCALATAAVLIAIQSFPVTKTLAWTQPDGGTTPIDSFKVTVDGTTTVVPFTTACTPDPTVCSVSVVIPASGNHTYSEQATNFLGDGPLNTLTINAQIPGKSSNLKIK